MKCEICNEEGANFRDTGSGYICECCSDEQDANLDPTPWCAYCGARTSDKCPCGPIAENN